MFLENRQVPSSVSNSSLSLIKYCVPGSTGTHVRYNLGTPGLLNELPHKHSSYKLDIMSESIRLTQLAVFSEIVECDVNLILGYK